MEASHALFSKGQDHDNMPTTEIELPNDAESIGILSMLTTSKLTASNGEARRLVQQGGIAIDDEKITDPKFEISYEALKNGITVKKGKKIYLKIVGK